MDAAQGLLLTAAFYWDLNDQTRAWAKKFADRYPKVPTMIHAGTYGAVTHYLKAVAAAGTDDGGAVVARMRRCPSTTRLQLAPAFRERSRPIPSRCSTRDDQWRSVQKRADLVNWPTIWFSKTNLGMKYNLIRRLPNGLILERHSECIVPNIVLVANVHQRGQQPI